MMFLFFVRIVVLGSLFLHQTCLIGLSLTLMMKRWEISTLNAILYKLKINKSLNSDSSELYGAIQISYYYYYYYNYYLLKSCV